MSIVEDFWSIDLQDTPKSDSQNNHDSLAAQVVSQCWAQLFTTNLDTERNQFIIFTNVVEEFDGPIQKGGINVKCKTLNKNHIRETIEGLQEPTNLLLCNPRQDVISTIRAMDIKGSNL